MTMSFEIKKANLFKSCVIHPAINLLTVQLKYLREEAPSAPDLGKKIHIFKQALRQITFLEKARGCSMEKYYEYYKKIINTYFDDTNLCILASRRGDTCVITPLKNILVALLDKFARAINKDKYHYGFFKGSSLRAGEYMVSTLTVNAQAILEAQPQCPSPLSVRQGSSD